MEKSVPSTLRETTRETLENLIEGNSERSAEAAAAPQAQGLLYVPYLGAAEISVEDLFTHVRSRLKFPSAQMLGAAASMFPDVPAGTAPAIVEPAPYNGAQEWAIGTRVYQQRQSGPWPRLELAPGMLRFTRTDVLAGEISAEKARARAIDQADFELDQLKRPMAFALGGDPLPAAVISAWSSKSRARLVCTVASLDLSSFVDDSAGLPCMITLTLPGDWLAIMPDAATAARIFDNFSRAWARKWGKPRWIWKREFQRRGAPHWHLWTVPPTEDLAGFKEWLSATWTRTLNPSKAHDRGAAHGVDEVCGCSEWCRSLSAGTGVDFAEGLRARDPKRLAIYFLKESLGGEGKAYQNAVPWAWCEHGLDYGQGEQGPLPARRVPAGSIGRFWGVRGLDKAVMSVPLHPAAAVRIWRVMRHIRDARIVTKETRQGYRKVACEISFDEVLDPVAGEIVTRVIPGKLVWEPIRRRKQRRRSRSKSSAGWIAVNNGADAGAQLGRYASQLVEEIHGQAGLLGEFEF